MLSIIGAIVGLLSSALPDVIGLFRQRQINKQKLELKRLQIEHDRLRHEYQMERATADADIREVEALHEEFAERKTTWKWVEALIQTVRPVITYAFFAAYASVKYAQLQLALRATSDGLVAITAIWHDSDQALFATIIAFWFGHRAMRRFRERP